MAKHESFEGHRGRVVLDDAATEVHDYIVVMMQHWLARGIDGWRLDAAYAVLTGFWSRVRHLALALVVLFHSRPARRCWEGPSHGWEVAF